MHLYDFITDEFQYQLKERAKAEAGRFEDTLKAYKRLFFDTFEQSRCTGASRYLPAALANHPSVGQWLEGFRKVIEADMPALRALFEEMIEGYYLFIRSKHYLAALKYQDMLDKYGLSDTHTAPLGLFFRGIRRNPEADVHDQKLYYHTPFFKRHLLDHGRFSFSGIPILYLGSSVADVYFEAGEQDLNATTLAVASFAPDPLAQPAPDNSVEKEKRRIYAITNQLYPLLNDVLAPLTDTAATLPAFEQACYQPQRECIVTYFRKFIIAQLCTFPQQHSDCSFYEEYVVPQLFTEALSIHQYGGVIFPSTQFGSRHVEVRSDLRSYAYKENLALFSIYRDQTDYDESLLQKFRIETLDAEEIRRSGQKTWLVKESLSRLMRAPGAENQTPEGSRMGALLTELGKKMSLYEALHVDTIPYLDTLAGNLEIRYLEKYLAFLETKWPNSANEYTH